jgi:hypothetical protein
MGSGRSSTIVRRWVVLYTRGLPSVIGDRRRAEIESDLWAHADEAAAMGRAPAALDLEMLLRLVLGVPADLAWRRSHRVTSHAPQTKEIDVHTPRPALSRLGIGIAIAWVAFLSFMTVTGLIATATTGDVYWLRAAAVGMAGAVVALLGALTVDRNAVVGLGLTIVGAATVGVGWTMFTDNGVYGAVVALLVGAVAVIRGMQVIGSRRAQPA